MKLRDIMTKRLVTKDAQTPIWEVARIMDEFDIGFVPITEGNKIVGVITDRDITVKCIKENFDNSKKVEEFMTKSLVTVNIDAQVSDVFRTMAKHKIKRVLVEEDRLIVGVIAISDIITHYDLMSELLPTLRTIWSIDKNHEDTNVDISQFEL